MKSKHKFTPGQVVPMEERALLSGFGFPGVVGPVTTLGLRGAFVLTSQTYQNLQTTVNTAIGNFEKTVYNLYNQDGGETAAFNTAVGINTLGTGVNVWSYATGSLLASLDAQMGAAEFRLPWGGGLGAKNPTGGSGLSNKTDLTTTNPSTLSLQAANPTGAGGSVAELMEYAIESPSVTSASTLLTAMNTVRTETLSFSVTADGYIGILPEYVAYFGPGDLRFFGLRNT
ncbi:MAG: hypothetical protein ABSH35_22115 [Isosphaeraceae bacterium]